MVGFPVLAAVHQSGNSSGVIHAGIYYQPGSLMAKLCVDGLHRMYAFCEKHDITHSRCGKVRRNLSISVVHSSSVV